MSNLFSIYGHTLANMADRFRMWLEKEGKIDPEKMPDEIDAVFNRGADIGYTTGHKHGKEAGIEEGKQAQYDYDWDMLQADGKRTAWNYGFYNCNIVGELNPKYTITPSGSIAQMFINNYNMTTIRKWGFPTSGITACTSAFAYCQNFLGFVDENGELIKGKAFFGNGVTTYQYAFSGNYRLEYICIDVSGVTASNPYNGMVTNCSKLKEVYIAGGKIKSTIQLQHCPLIVESMVNVIEHLENYAGTTNAFTNTVQFNGDCWTKLEATTPPDGYDSWRGYVQDLGWNT